MPTNIPRVINNLQEIIKCLKMIYTVLNINKYAYSVFKQKLAAFIASLNNQTAIFDAIQRFEIKVFGAVSQNNDLLARCKRLKRKLGI